MNENDTAKKVSQKFPKNFPKTSQKLPKTAPERPHWTLCPTRAQVAYAQTMQHRMLWTVSNTSTLYDWLAARYDASRVALLFARLGVGSPHDGSAVTYFPYVDRLEHTVDIRAVTFDADGRPLPEDDPFWLSDDVAGGRPVPLCLFGESLLSMLPFAPVNVTDSERTALLATLWCPDRTWLAAPPGGLTADNARVLAGREVTLWPPASALDDWQRTADTLGPQRDIRFRFPSAYVAVLRNHDPPASLGEIVAASLR